MAISAPNSPGGFNIVKSNRSIATKTLTPLACAIYCNENLNTFGVCILDEIRVIEDLAIGSRILRCRVIVPPGERVVGLQDLDRDRSRDVAEIRESCRDWQHRVAEKIQRSLCACGGTGHRRNVAVGFRMEENLLDQSATCNTPCWLHCRASLAAHKEAKKQKEVRRKSKKRVSKNPPGAGTKKASKNLPAERSEEQKPKEATILQQGAETKRSHQGCQKKRGAEREILSHQGSQEQLPKEARSRKRNIKPPGKRGAERETSCHQGSEEQKEKHQATREAKSNSKK